MMDSNKIAGTLLLVGGILCFMGIIIAEIFYPGYSTSQNYISDLGVGPSAVIFNSSIFLIGVLAVVGAYFVQLAFDFKLFTIMSAIAGIGAIGVGLFTEDAGIIHGIFSLVVFLFAGLSAITSYKLQKPPLSYFSILLGATSLLALVLFGSGVYLGLGKGGMERMIAYPALLWTVSFGSYLINTSKGPTATE